MIGRKEPILAIIYWLLLYTGPKECFSGEGWDRSSNSSVHIF